MKSGIESTPIPIVFKGFWISNNPILVLEYQFSPVQKTKSIKKGIVRIEKLQIIWLFKFNGEIKKSRK